MRRALEGLPGVVRAEVSLAGDTAEVVSAGPLRWEQVESVIRATVILPGLRRLLDRVGRAWGLGRWAGKTPGRRA